MERWLGILRLVVFAGSLCCISSAIQAADTTTKDGGRYQLMAAKVTAGGKDGVVEVSSLFKIDTTTGQTWIFSWRVQGDGTIVQEWRSVK